MVGSAAVLTCDEFLLFANAERGLCRNCVCCLYVTGAVDVELALQRGALCYIVVIRLSHRLRSNGCDAVTAGIH